jgi:hypothetical protein
LISSPEAVIAGLTTTEIQLRTSHNKLSNNVTMGLSEVRISTHEDTWDPTPQQRAIYNFHEARLSVDADDIYSPMWYERSKSWEQEFGTSDTSTSLLDSWEQLEDFHFGEFYLEHPVAAYSLWLLLQAYYALDRSVCGYGMNEDERVKIQGWQKMKPFQYLKSKNVQKKWRRSLEGLGDEIKDKTLKQQALLSRLNEILELFQRVVDLLDALHESFALNLNGEEFGDEMLKSADKATDDRRRMIAELFLKLDQPAD